MTQEILDYLLIRSLILSCEDDAIIEQINGDEEGFAYFIKNVSLLMQEENFLFVSSAFKDRVMNVIAEYRFDFNKNKEYCEQMNYIIGRFREHELMSDDRKRDIANNWIEEEAKNRGLPKCYHNVEDLFYLISLDALYIKGIISIGEEFVVSNPVEYVSIINIIMNKAPKCFEDDKLFLEVTRENLSHIVKLHGLGFTNSKIVKSTYKNLNEKYEKCNDVEFETHYSLKKTKK